MTQPYDPLLYALVHAGTPGDLAFYAEVCEGGRRVLELGCGYGRVLSHLVEQGHEVHGLDLHAGLLAMARESLEAMTPEQQARGHLHFADMRDFDIEGEFDRIIIPHSGLYCLLTEADLDACLARVVSHLAPGGRVIADAYAADAFHEQCGPEDQDPEQLDEVALIAAEGTVYDVFERSDWDKPAQRMLATYVYRPDGGGQSLEFAIDQRYLLRPQLDAALARAGLRATSTFGGFDRAEYDAETSEVIAFVAERR